MLDTLRKKAYELIHVGQPQMITRNETKTASDLVDLCTKQAQLPGVAIQQGLQPNTDDLWN